MYKRSSINGTSPLDMKALNDNFSALWMKVFGDISISDVDDSIKSVIYTNWLQPQGEGNFDSSYPFTMRFYIPPNTHSIKKGELNLIASKYRMDSGIASNNTESISIAGFTIGQSTETSSKSGGGTTVSSGNPGGMTGYPVTDDAIVSQLGVRHNHGIGVPTHNHSVTVASHTHDIAHSHSITSTAVLPPHSHSLSKGIIVDTDALPNIFVKVNGVDLGLTLNDSNISVNNINILDKLLIGQWNTVEVSCNDKSDGTKGIARMTVYGIVELLQNYK